jgi:hypothetical protein
MPPDNSLTNVVGVAKTRRGVRKKAYTNRTAKTTTLIE